MEQTLGKRIVQNRKRLGMTQDQLAEKVGVTAQAVSKWENDQSCPDIATLPRLAKIFGITTDALLGLQEETAHPAEVVAQELASDDFHTPKGSWEFTYEAGRHGAFAIAVEVLGLGVLTLLSRLLDWDVSFWSILWPWSLAVFGLFAMIKKFSFFPLGCLVFGVYFLLNNLGFLPFSLGTELVLPAILVLLGISLLADAVKQPRKHGWHIRRDGSEVSQAQGGLVVEDETFSCNASFGESSYTVAMSRLCEGSINSSFGESTVDLSGVEMLAENCSVSASCSFGELTILVPRRFQVIAQNTTSFGDVQISGHPYQEPQGQLALDAHVSFGEITVEYV